MMKHGPTRGAAALLAIALGLAATPAAAQPAAQPGAAPPAGAAPAAAKPNDAKALFASGEKKFKASDYAGALSDFEAANSAKPSPEAQRYIAVCHDNLGHYVEAAAAYEAFASGAPAAMKDKADDARKRVEAIKAMPGKVHVETTPPGAQISVDVLPAGIAQSPTDLELAPGKHKLHITAEGFEPTDKEVEVGYASKQDVKVELKKAEVPEPPPPAPVASDSAGAPPPPPPPVEPRSKVPAYVTGGVAIAAAGVGTFFGLRALSQSSDFDKNPTNDLADDGENNALIADMMFGIAITFGVTSAVLFLSSDAPTTAKAKLPATTAKKKMTVVPTPIVTSTGGGAGCLVRF